MEEQIHNSLEQIQNPILVILLGVLMLAVAALWLRDAKSRELLVEMLMENIGAIKDVNTKLTSVDDRLDEIEKHLPSQ
jgi:hypothetical protein